MQKRKEKEKDREREREELGQVLKPAASQGAVATVYFLGVLDRAKRGCR